MFKFDLENTLLITHAHCFDGITCAILFIAAGGKKENICFSTPDHLTMDDRVCEHLEIDDRDILLVDISISEETAEFYAFGGWRQKLFIIDHHKTSIPLAKYDFAWIEEKNNACGSMMFYEWLSNNYEYLNLFEYSELVKYADDYDRWIHNYSESKILASLFDAMGQEMFLNRFVSNSSTNLNKEEEFLLKVNKSKEDFDIKKRKNDLIIYTKEIDDKFINFGFVVCPGSNVSELGEAIYNDPKIDVHVAIMINGDKISMRSRKDCPVDLSNLAKKFNGGGHKNASGFSFVGLTGKDLVEIIMEGVLKNVH